MTTCELPPELTDRRAFEEMLGRERCEDEFEMEDCRRCKERSKCSFRNELQALKMEVD